MFRDTFPPLLRGGARTTQPRRLLLRKAGESLAGVRTSATRPTRARRRLRAARLLSARCETLGVRLERFAA